ncbi:GNAT family N-acetyltransferase [Clostridium tagluense]|nr:GNAT family N-acetyltransferase [Clostridium tagluense]MBZ9635187.1 GNAT family N-acetyltransferase [Clostridium sp. FP1]
MVLANDNYKGFGYGTEAIELSIAYVFNTLKLKYIYADRWEYKLNYILTNPNGTK